MATKVTMPQLGESVTEGTISKWLVHVGETINKYDSLCEVMTDKVNAEVPASFAGTITEIVAEEGETVEVGGLICYIAEAGQARTASAHAPAQEIAIQKGELRTEVETVQSMKNRYSPAVLKLAQENDMDLRQVQGTGLGGRVTRKDLLTLLKEESIPIATSTATHDLDVIPLVNLEADKDKFSRARPVAPGDIEIPVSGVRRAIAAKMVQSKHEAPHAWTMVEVDVTDLVNYRNKAKREFKQREGINLTFLPFFIKAIVEALKEYPMINSQWTGDRIIQKKDIHISIAVATEDALYVPVIKHTDGKSIVGIAREVDELARKTRDGKLALEEMQGGTFTVNNTGSFGSIQSSPIINYPQAAILSVESIVKRPVVINGMIAIRDMVNLCLSLDHRILDGLVCGRFLQNIKQKLESMGEGMIL